MIKILDFFEWAEIESSIKVIDEILSTGILHYPNESPFTQAAFVMVLIRLRDLMYKVEKHGSRIDFTDDVLTTAPGVKPKVEDVSDLIKFVRDAMCHPDIDHHNLTEHTRMSWTVIYGKPHSGGLVMIAGQDLTPKADYEDDVAYCFGAQRIYLQRHILRAFAEAKQQLLPMIEASKKPNK